MSRSSFRKGALVGGLTGGLIGHALGGFVTTVVLVVAGVEWWTVAIYEVTVIVAAIAGRRL